ncbi:MAG: hypothetical protein H6684_04815 [Deltaproteobacteria bacterium]|nr:hypothetical protein [bacterium]MCB9475903.1 hypothetical protein [Deltaproteobacteria bacterium]MCB9479704.1 hypothetical protein [Deltaproteobacteria bacterium]MCB9488035.1 hypothetical protein [Deltaproteobacteria bacterium]
MSAAVGILGRLNQVKDEAISNVTQELLTNPKFAQALGNTVQSVAKTKQRIDRNVALAMSLSGLPSKRDYSKLAHRAKSLNKNIDRLEERLDDVVLRLERLGEKVEKL